VLEGSEQSSGDRVRFNARLINAETGAHLWADKVDAGRADLLAMADEVVTGLARSLEIETNAIEAARVARAAQGNLDAEDLALRCQAGFDSATTGSSEQAAAFDLCDRALQIDGRNVVALSILAIKYYLRASQIADREADIQRAADLLARALALEPDSYRAHAYKAQLLVYQKRQEEALVEAERSLALNPSFIPAYVPVCQANWALGDRKR
jgi:tetratricopeptide (TPR) repeat protein